MGGRPPRLDREKYIGERTVAFTFNIEFRHRVFVDQDEMVEQLVKRLRVLAEKHRCNVPVYCFMPDHIHLLVQGYDYGSDPLSIAEKFKTSLGIVLKARGFPPTQEGLYDHIVRSSEDWRAQARYFALNPVRAGLVENLFDYPYVGCLHGHLGDIFPD